MELVRDLDLGTSARTYGERRGEDGTSYLFHAAWHENEWVVVRQMERRADGRTTRLSDRRHLIPAARPAYRMFGMRDRTARSCRLHGRLEGDMNNQQVIIS